MYKMTLTNESNQSLDFNDVGGMFKITQVAGLYPADALINTDQAAYIDGGRFNSSKVNMRTINFGFSIERDAEEARRQVYRVLQPKRPVRLNYVSDIYDVYIEGYVQSLVVNHFDAKQTVTMVMLCPFPYFKNAQEMIEEFSSVVKKFHFPFASTEEPKQLIMGEIKAIPDMYIRNGGMIETGLTIELYARGPVSGIKVYNYDTREYIGVNFQMIRGDRITITTGQGNKTATLLREGVSTNIFNEIMEGSTWLQLPPGGMTMVYSVEAGLSTNLILTVRHFNLYEGV